MPHWIVCFWSSSDPRPGEIRPGCFGGLTARHRTPPGPAPPGLGVVEKLLRKLGLRLSPIRRVAGREESTWLILYQPISSTA